MHKMMRSLPWCLALLPVAFAQQGSAPATTATPLAQEAQESATVEPATVEPVAEPYAGGIYAGLVALTDLARAGEHEAALELSASLLSPTPFMSMRTSLEESTGGFSEALFARVEGPLEKLGLETAKAADRADVHYIRGHIQGQTGDLPGARKSFELAIALAGSGGRVRLDAAYNVATLELLVGEVLRAQIPEISGQPAPGAGGPNAAPGAAPGAGGEEQADPLELARAAYLLARTRFIERLRLDTHDEDARANAELVIRRLRELDEIEREREQQEQEQQDSEQSEEQNDNQESEDQNSEDKSESEQESQDESQPEQSEEEQEEPQDSQEESEDEQEEEQEEESESESEEDEQQESEAQPDPEEQQYMTREEAQRLMKLLEEQEEEGEKIKAQLRRTGYQGGKRDW